MKKIVMIFALGLLTTSVWAQDADDAKNTQNTTAPAKFPAHKGFVTNGFWDNWEISIGGGMGTAFSSKPDAGAQHKRWGYELNFGLTKWVSPVFGGRLQLQGGEFANFDSPNSSKDKWPYIFLHADLMVNFSNWVGGYRDDRAYYAIPFVGAGYFAGNISDNSRNASGHPYKDAFAFSLGLLNKFRISPSFDFNIELKTLIVPTAKVPVVMGGPYTFGMSATVGITYRFNKRTFDRVPAPVVCDYSSYADRIKELEDANADLADQLAAAKAATPAPAPAPVVEPATPASNIYFDLDNAELTARDMTRLQVLAEQIKNGPSDEKYTIIGYADKQTGTTEGNQTLSENRAKVVYDYLVGQGVAADRLSCEGRGDTENPFDIQKANRVVIVK